MPSSVVLECCEAIANKSWTIAFAESCTAGRATSEFSLSPVSGEILIGSIVSYDAQFKEHILSIPPELVEKYTPESAEVTAAMAKNFCLFSGSDICVAITGLTKSGGSETPEKPVGTIFIHIIFPHTQISSRTLFDGSPTEIITKAIDEIALLILEEIAPPQQL